MSVIRWYRSWPTEAAFVRVRRQAHVVDHLPRLRIHSYDYLTAEPRLPSDRPGFCLLEWDVAFESAERIRFAHAASVYPKAVLVAPYNLYPIDGVPECAHRDQYGDPVEHGSLSCASFGFGCIYLPHDLVSDFMHDAGDLGMTDATFSRYARETGAEVRIDWSFRPHHLLGD